MAVPRLLSQNRSLLTRGFTASRIVPVTLRSARPAFSNRLFTSSASFQEAEQTLAAATEARSEVPSEVSSTSTPENDSLIYIGKINKRASKSEIEKYIRSKGFEVKRTKISFDRFNFHNIGRAVVELANAKQAQEAIQSLNKQLFKDAPLEVSHVSPGIMSHFPEDGTAEKNKAGHVPRFFFDDGNNAVEAVKPLLEGRRFMVQAQTPGWRPKGNETANKTSQRILSQHFGPFGIESISRISAFLGDKKPQPRLLCQIDFTTKEGADKAFEAINDTYIEDRRILLLPPKLAPWRAHQIGKLNPDLLKQLQEKDLAPLKTFEDKFTTPRTSRASPDRTA